MAWEENTIKYINKYNAEKYDQISFRAPRGDKERIKAAAEKAGMSMAAYIMSAVEEKISKNKKENS
jgi:predicted DNA-binding protein